MKNVDEFVEGDPPPRGYRSRGFRWPPAWGYVPPKNDTAEADDSGDELS